ncbi:putative damage-inducible protein DinB [Kibdelosporangium banguiense]|uniref:Damage-inducible protein DinB n=1 Tax=Kibdelosporangium banguiense TaxID=1365924 RepID=A0ABS4TFU2_9PSEU|nr:DinB family protein [Kibdelosporangium banguiense]MBP2323293.1 putative damage-inducible protein DinB [Kibdelosporangium banguiense]
MSWTAPQVGRIDAPPAADERTMLLNWLDYHRSTFLMKCAGLTPEQLATRSVPPSTLSLLGLIRHLADVELVWFRRRLGGEDVPMNFYKPGDPDPDFDHNGATAQTAEADYNLLITEIELAKKSFEGMSLDHSFDEPPHRYGLTARWVLAHMIEEYARHNGHADLLRERIDGAVGD